MTFTWTPPVPREHRPGHAPEVLHVLFAFDGPKLVVAGDEQGRQLLGVAVDEDLEEDLTRWLFAPIPPEQLVSLLEGYTGLHALFVAQRLQVVDVSREWSPVARWELDGALVPPELLPEPEARLPELTEEFRQSLLSEQRELVRRRSQAGRTRVLFSGRPVAGQRGISLGFAASALGDFQQLVAATHASSRGELGARGPLPERPGASLMLTDMPRGSVGFELVEVTDPASRFPPELAPVLEEVGELLEAAASGDQQLAEAMAELEPRVLTPLREFFGLLRREQATLRLEVQDHRHSFDEERIQAAADRTAQLKEEEEELLVAGQLIGLLPVGRRFEFRQADGTLVRGRLAAGADVDALRDWMGRDGQARLRVRSVVRAGGTPSAAYTLLGIEPG